MVQAAWDNGTRFMNRDTLYSSVVLDLSKPVTMVMPETAGRYQSLHVINQDHYSFAKIEPGRYGLTQDEVEPIKHLVFTAAGWGGMPLKNTFGDLGSVAKNDGTPHVLTARDVPVRAFWSVIAYDANGYIPQNDTGIYSYNSVTAEPNADGSITIHFGGDRDQIN